MSREKNAIWRNQEGPAMPDVEVGARVSWNLAWREGQVGDKGSSSRGTRHPFQHFESVADSSTVLGEQSRWES